MFTLGFKVEGVSLLFQEVSWHIVKSAEVESVTSLVLLVIWIGLFESVKSTCLRHLASQSARCETPTLGLGSIVYFLLVLAIVLLAQCCVTNFLAFRFF